MSAFGRKTGVAGMTGARPQFGAVEAAKRAVEAGNDVLLMPTNIRETIDAMVAGVREGRYDERRIDASVRRILLMKAELGLPRERLVPLDSVRTVVGVPAHREAARTIAERSMTLVRDAGRRLPLRTGRTSAPSRRMRKTLSDWRRTSSSPMKISHLMPNSAQTVAVATPCWPAPVSAMIRVLPMRRASSP